MLSPNRRIFLNIVATYGRSLFALVCGLFSARWVLEALGQEDFGLYGVVGGLVAFIGIVNSLLGCAVGRFYAVSVGAADSSSSVFCLLFPNVLISPRQRRVRHLPSHAINDTIRGVMWPVDRYGQVPKSILLRMKELGVSQTELAVRMKASRLSGIKVLHGEINITFASAVRFAKALQLDFFSQLVQPSTDAHYVFPRPSYQHFPVVRFS